MYKDWHDGSCSILPLHLCMTAVMSMYNVDRIRGLLYEAYRIAQWANDVITPGQHHDYSWTIQQDPFMSATFDELLRSLMLSIRMIA